MLHTMLKAFCECQKKCQQTQNASNQLLHPHPCSMLRCLLGVEETAVMVVVVVHHDPPILGTTLHLVLAIGVPGSEVPASPTNADAGGLCDVIHDISMAHVSK